MSRFSLSSLIQNYLWAVLAALVLLPGCGDDEEQPAEPGPGISETDPDTPSTPAPVQIPAGGIVLPDLSFKTVSAEAFPTSSLAGKVWLLHAVTPGSETLGPTMSTIKGAYESLTQEQGVDALRIATVVIGDDSGQLAQDIATVSTGQLLQWHVLHSTREDVESLLTTIGEGAVLGPDGMSDVLLIDRAMRVRGVFQMNDESAPQRLLAAMGMVMPEFDIEQYGLTDAGAPTGDNVTHLAQPPMILDNEWLDDVAAQQRAASIGVFHDFTFKETRESSGITHDPQILDEQRSRLQVNHFDHGNGVCVADIDGDGLLDVYFVTQAGRNELWKNSGDGKFEDVTDTAGVALADRIGVTASFGDLDNDGDPDLYVTTVRNGNVLFANDGQGNFQDVTEASGLGYSGHSSAPVLFDYDRDGLLDVFLCNVGQYTTDEEVAVRVDEVTRLPAEPEVKYFTGVKDSFAGHLKPEREEASLLFRNQGGLKFEDVTEATGLEANGWTGDATPIDANNDGWLDLYVLSMQGHDEYYENQEGKSFIRRSREVFPSTPWGAMGVKVLDYNNDGLFDLFVTDMHSDMSEDIRPDREKLKARMQWTESFLKSGGRSIYGNAFYQQTESGEFAEVSDAVGAENYWPWGLSVGDLNADGFQDAFLTSSMCFPYRYGVNSVLLNDGNNFHESAFLLGVEPRPAGQLMRPWFVLDADGADKEHPVCQGRSGTVVVWSALGSRTSAIFDFDEDGDLDIITGDFNSPPLVLVSNLTEKSEVHAVKITLRGTTSNRDGIGAVVTVTAGDTSWKQVHDGKSGYLSQSSMPLYFGLGAASAVDSVQVTWPSGVKQTVESPDISSGRLTIQEPAESN